MMVSKPIASSLELAEQAFYAKLQHLGSPISRVVAGGGMQFGITIKPDMPVERIVALTRQAEAAGFQYGWIFDSPVLWLGPSPVLSLVGSNTKKKRLGA